MSDSTTSSNEGTTTGGNAGAFTPPASQDELDRIVGERLARERAKYADYEDLKAKAAKYDEHEDAQKSELQRLTEALEAERAQNAALQVQTLRAQVAADKGVPAALLSGDTEEALVASAEALIAFRGETSPTPPDPRGIFAPNEGRSSANQLTPADEALSVLGFGN